MAVLRLLITALIFGAATALPANRNISHTASSNYRLPDNVAPIHYNIKLIPYIEEGNFTFDGESNITIRIRKPTQNLSLHAVNLTIDEAATKLVDSVGNIHEPAAYNYNDVTEILVIEFDNDLSSGVYVLSMKFVGILTDDEKIFGFYRTFYLTEDDRKVWLVATQFEATMARRAFPCWDEPALKATFNISIKHNRNLTALSNMPMRDQTEDGNEDGTIWTHFEKTPIMSTYLVAFVVSDYVRVPTEDSNVNVWCRPALAPYAHFVERVATQSAKILTEYTNITNKVPKMDHVATPKFPDGGAMENWGLVIYGEKDFSYNEEQDTTVTKQRIAEVGAHEMTHHWFGNLVTPSWWSEVWLSEGLTTFFTEHLLDELFPEWKRINYFVIKVTQKSLHNDIEKNMMPVTADVNTPDEISSLFSDSSYAKAPSILRMLQHIVTKDVFRKGIIKFLHANQFGSVTSDDFWSALQEALDESDVVPHDDYKVREVMDAWIKRRHYPVVRVTRNYENGDVILTQEHFRPRNTTTERIDDDDDDKWWIPITYATQSDPDFSKTSPSHWLKPQDQSVTIKGIDPNDWIIVNLQETGYYRVQYDSNNWWKIATYLNSDDYTKIHVLNRAQLIDDYVHLVSNTSFEGNLFIKLMEYLRRETDDIAHASATKLLEIQKTFFKLPDFFQIVSFVKSHVLRTLSALAKKVGYEEDPAEDDIRKLQRSSILEWACNFGTSECRKTATLKLNEHLADPETHKIPPNLKDWIFCNGMMEANASTLHKFVEKYATLDEYFLDYLTCSENPDILHNILNAYSFWNESAITNWEYKVLFDNIVEKHADNDLVLDNLLATVNNTLSRGYTLEKMFTDITNNIYSTDRLEKISNFVKTNFGNKTFEQIETTIDERRAKLRDIIAGFPSNDKTRIKNSKNQNIKRNMYAYIF